MSDALYTITIDHEQKRLDGLNDRLSVICSGQDMLDEKWSNCWLEPLTNSAMLEPAPINPSFWTSNSGVYAKPALADLTFSTTFREFARFPSAGSYWQTSTAGAYLKTATLGKNRGVFVGFHNYTAGDDFIQFTCGWGTTTDTSNGVVLEVYSKGKIKVYKDGLIVKTINLSFTSDDLNWLMLIPARKRELFIILNGIGGEVILFTDIDEDDSNPTITPAEKFWVKNGTGSLDVQVAPLKFQTSGSIVTPVTSFSHAPASTATQETWINPAIFGGTTAYHIYGAEAFAGSVTTTASLRNDTDSGIFVQDSINTRCRLKITFSSGDGIYSPFVYGISTAFKSSFLSTDDSEVYAEVMNFAQRPKLEIGDDNSGAHFTFDILDPEGLSAHVAAVSTQNNRPCLLSKGTTKVIDGVLYPEAYKEETTSFPIVSMTVRDAWSFLDNYMFQESVPLDGATWTSCIKFLLARVGLYNQYTDDGVGLDISSTSTVISSVPGKDSGEFGTVIRAGDTAAKWIRILMEDYASTWEYGFRPTSTGIEFYALSQADLLSDGTFVTLYNSIADAEAAGHIGATERDKAYKFVYREYTDTLYEPEGNDIRVTGQDLRTRKLLQAWKRDEDSIAVDTVPSARPSNWLGSLRRVGLFSPSINTQTEVNDSCAAYYERLTPSTYYCTFVMRWYATEDDVPLWKSHNVFLDGKGLFRVVAMSVDLESEITGGDEGMYYRTATLTCRFIQTETPDEE